MPASTRLPVPVLVSEPPAPWITPETVVERLLPPTDRFIDPRWISPAPSIDPAVTVIPADNRACMSNTPPALLMKRAFPPVALTKNPKKPSLTMVALPAVLLLVKSRKPEARLWMTALPAVLESKKPATPSLVMVALPAVLEFEN